MSKIGDLFIRLGAKTEGLEKGLAKSANSVKNFSRQMALMTANAVAGLAQIAMKGLDMALNLAKSTQIFGDAWDRSMAKAGAAFNTFAQAVMNWDWNGLGDKMRSAMTGAGNAQDMRDLEAEMQGSINIQKAAMEEELEIEKIAMRNLNLSYDERKAAAERYLQKIKPIYDQQKSYYYDLAQAEMDSFIRGAGVTAVASTRKELESFLTNVVNNPSVLGALFNASTGNMTSSDSGILASLNVDKQTMESYQKFANHYQTMFGSDKTRNQLTDSIVKMYVANSAFTKETRNVATTLNTLNSKMEGSAGTADENAEATKRLAAARELLNDKLEEGISITDKSAGMKTPLQMGSLAPMQQADYSKQIEWFERVQAASEELAYSLEDGLIGALDELANAFAGVDGADFGSVVKALLGPLADAAVKAGAIIMFSGEAMDQLKKAFANPFGGGAAGAIVAGGALMAIGVAAKAGLAAIGKGAGSAGTATSSAAASGQGMTQTQYEDMNINVKIEGKLKGSDIVLASRGAQASWAR